MNAIEFEKQEIINKCVDRNILILNEIDPISIKEYMSIYCDELIKDLKLISNTYKINSKLIFKKLLYYCYQHKIKKPRLRLNYKTNEIELYNNKRFQIIVVYRIKYK